MLLTKYYSGDQIEKNEMGGACSTYGERRSAYRFLVEKCARNRQLGIPRRRWEDIQSAAEILPVANITGLKNCQFFLPHSVLRWIFRKWDVGIWTESIWHRIGTGDEYL